MGVYPTLHPLVQIRKFETPSLAHAVSPRVRRDLTFARFFQKSLRFDVEVASRRFSRNVRFKGPRGGIRSESCRRHNQASLRRADREAALRVLDLSRSQLALHPNAAPGQALGSGASLILLPKAIPVKFMSPKRSREPNVGFLTSASQVLSRSYGFKPFEAYKTGNL